MSNPFSLLPPLTFEEETRGFTHSGGAVFTLAFRVIGGGVQKARLRDTQQGLTRRFAEGGALVSLPGQPPQALSKSMCEDIGLLMACQVPPKQEAEVRGGITQDATGLGWKPYNLELWVDLANRAEEVFYAAVALVRILEARAEDNKVKRWAVAIAYQQEIPEGLEEDDFVAPSLAGLTEGSPLQGVDSGNDSPGG